MKWNAKDLSIFIQSKEYVDTVFIPLSPIAFNGQMMQTVSMGEYCSILTNEIERQLHGRTLVVPPFTYLKSEESGQALMRLQQWIKVLSDEGFKYIILLTSDNEWKQVEHSLDASLIWLPVIPLEHMDEKYKNEIVTEQTKQLLQIITNKWQNES